MAILRKPKERDFSQISNNITQNRRLSWKARGILCYLFSKPNGWEVRRSDLLNESPKDKKDSLGSGLAELEKEGFLVWTQARGAGGKFESVLDIYEEALPKEKRGTNTRGALAFVTEGGFSAQNAGFLAENPQSAENPQRQNSLEPLEGAENIGENVNSEISTVAGFPQPADFPPNNSTEPLRENRSGKPASVNNKDLKNTETNNTEVSSNEETNLLNAEPKTPEPENFLSKLSEAQITELQKAICRLTYQKRGAVKLMNRAEWQAVAEIFGFWVSFWKLTKATRLTPERGRAVLDRLRSASAWTVAEIKEGIIGNSRSPHHSGANERGQTYNDLELICRTDQHLAVAFGFAEGTNENETQFENNKTNAGNRTGGNIGNNGTGGNRTGGKQTFNAVGRTTVGNSEDDEAALRRIGARPK